MNIYTDRLVLRAPESYDADVLREIINDPDTEAMLGGWSFPTSEKNQREWLDSLKNTPSLLRCMLSDKDDTKKAYGTTMLTDIDYKNGTAQIHIKLHSSARGKGLGTEALSAMANYAFTQLRLHCVYAHINSYNGASCHMCEKCGFEKEGVLKARVYKQGEYCDVYSYSLINKNL